METVPISRYLVLLLLLLPAALLGAVGLFQPWFYMLTQKEQINLLSFWSWQGMHTVETLNQDDDTLHVQFKTWQQLKLTHVDVTNKVSYYLTISGLAAVGVALTHLTVAAFLFRLPMLYARWNPKKSKRILSGTLGLAFIALFVGYVLLLFSFLLCCAEFLLQGCAIFGRHACIATRSEQ